MRTLFGLAAVLATLWLTTGAAAQEDSSARTAAKLDAVKKKLTSQTYDLRYGFAPNETLRHKIVHLVTVKTTIKGTTQTAKTRSVSVKAWKVTGVDVEGNITFAHSVDSVDMWQQVSGQQAIRYNSEQDKKPPPEYEMVAKSVGVPLAVVTIDPRGKVVRREKANRPIDLGVGQLTMPLPGKAAKLGDSWTAPGQVQVKLKNGQVKTIKTRQVFTLEKVETGMATILVRTDVLTPVREPSVKSQLIQRLAHGKIKFDVDAGRVVSKQMDWDETVVGFNGPDSNMQYLARFTEDLLADGDSTTAQSEPAETAKPSSESSQRSASASPIKGRGDKPALRRK